MPDLTRKLKIEISPQAFMMFMTAGSCFEVTGNGIPEGSVFNYAFFDDDTKLFSIVFTPEGGGATLTGDLHDDLLAPLPTFMNVLPGDESTMEKLAETEHENAIEWARGSSMVSPKRTGINGNRR